MSDTVVRFDRIELPPKCEVTPEGYIRGDAILTRSGVFEYALADGKIQREYRPPDEVFKADSLKSFGLVPITESHPTVRRADGEPLLDSATAPRFAVGATGSEVRQDGTFMRAPIAIYDAKAVKAVRSGKCGLSNGYSAKLDFTPGVTPEGQSYDCVQREIRGNHVAIVDQPRAGAVAQIRLDSAGNQTEEENEHMSTKLSTVKLDGIDYEAAPEVANALLKAERERDAVKAEHTTAQSALKTKTDEADALKAKLDSATTDLEALKKQDRTADVRAAVKARVALETIARRALPADQHAKLDEMDDAAIRKAVIAAKKPTVKLDGQSEAYAQAMYDIVASEVLAEKKPSAQRLQSTERLDSGDPVSADAARARMIAANKLAWQSTKAA